MIEINPFISANETFVRFRTRLCGDKLFPALLINAWAYLLVSATKLLSKVAVKNKLKYATGAEFLVGQCFGPDSSL